MWIVQLPSPLPSAPSCSPAATPSPNFRFTFYSRNLQTNCKIHLRTQAVQSIKHNKAVAHWERQSVSHALTPSTPFRQLPTSLALLTHKSFASAARELSNGKQCKNIPTVWAKSFRLSSAEHKTWNLAAEALLCMRLLDTLWERQSLSKQGKDDLSN